MKPRILTLAFALALTGCSTRVVAFKSLAQANQHVAAAQADGKQILAIGGTLGRDNAVLRTGSDRLGSDINLFQQLLDMIRPR